MSRRARYESDISREQFNEIKNLLESARKRTKPRELDLYDIFCGVLYILKSGCQWRMLPSDFPKWQSVYAYFTKWREEEILAEVLKKIGWRYSQKQWSEREDKLHNN